MPPLADVLKTKIYNAYLHNILESSSSSDAVVVRAVSAKFGVGMERVRAIIRLKELEKSWKDSVRPPSLSPSHPLTDVRWIDRGRHCRQSC
jgi:hypothetical protein